MRCAVWCDDTKVVLVLVRRQVEQEFTRRVQQLVTNTDLSVPAASLITARYQGIYKYF